MFVVCACGKYTGCAFVRSDMFVRGDIGSVCDIYGVVSINTGGITSFSADVDGDDTVVTDTGVSVVNKTYCVC